MRLQKNHFGAQHRPRDGEWFVATALPVSTEVEKQSVLVREDGGFEAAVWRTEADSEPHYVHREGQLSDTVMAELASRIESLRATDRFRAGNGDYDPWQYETSDRRTLFFRHDSASVLPSSFATDFGISARDATAFQTAFDDIWKLLDPNGFFGSI